MSDRNTCCNCVYFMAEAGGPARGVCCYAPPVLLPAFLVLAGGGGGTAVQAGAQAGSGSGIEVHAGAVVGAPTPTCTRPTGEDFDVACARWREWQEDE